MVFWSISWKKTHKGRYFGRSRFDTFPLIRPHDERSSMMTVRTKFKGSPTTDEKEFVDRRVLVYTMSRRNIVLDYTSSENASVQVDDSV